jgi:hypothetical protein
VVSSPRSVCASFTAVQTPATGPECAQAQALRDAKRREEKLERDIRREDKALAEAAALLVLQKKFQSLLAEGEAE